jgi:conjugative transfer signal peptidase TraF
VKAPRSSFVLLGIGGVAALLGILGFRFNLTGSLPYGVYHTTGEPARRGSIVHVCLPPQVAAFARERGYLGPGSCAGGVRPLGKMVLAVGGDVVVLRPDGIRVNGVAIPHSATLPRDSRGRPLPHAPWGEYRLPAGELWLFSPYRRNAYDSRYFGPVKIERMISVLEPVWTWSLRVRGTRRLPGSRRMTVRWGSRHPDAGVNPTASSSGAMTLRSRSLLHE